MNNMMSTRSFNPPWVIAHRGFKKNYPENTLVAFQAAMDAGAQMIELDVTLTRDRKPVVIHDATLDRTSNGHGPVKEYTMEELKQFDAGSWFHSDFANQRLPELGEVLELVNGRVITNIEIKANAYEPHHPPDAIETQVVELVKQKKMQDAVLLSSFNMDILAQIATMKNPPTIALISEKAVTSRIVERCKRLKIFSWHPHYRVLTAKQVKLIRSAGLRIFPYGVDTFEDFVKMIDMKVDGVITDDPASADQWSRIHKASEP
jgi:glycerophosphoryl diester phosphodiesterase